MAQRCRGTSASALLRRLTRALLSLTPADFSRPLALAPASDLPDPPDKTPEHPRPLITLSHSSTHNPYTYTHTHPDRTTYTLSRPRNMGPQRYERVRRTPRPRLHLHGGSTSSTTTTTTQHDEAANTPLQVSAHDDADHAENTPSSQQTPYAIPASPPPSFHSRASSPTHASRRLLSDDPLAHEPDSTLADTFAESDDDEDESDDRQRLMRGSPEDAREREREREEAESRNLRPARPGRQRSVTELPVFDRAGVVGAGAGAGAAQGGRIYGGGQNDGVFANLSAKPTRGEELEEKPPVRLSSVVPSCLTYMGLPHPPLPPHISRLVLTPPQTYEQAAADATPPYWETTILAPGTFGDEVFVEGLPVGSVFSFIWNAMISMSFQLVGFLLTYLLHTTHAAKNGSRAGLGITLVQYGFTMKSATSLAPGNDSPGTGGGAGGFDVGGVPSDPNKHDFDPSALGGSSSGAGAGDEVGKGISGNDWIAYGLMIVGWFILIKSVSDFVRARRHEQLVLQSPDRGLGVAVVAEGESPERAV